MNNNRLKMPNAKILIWSFALLILPIAVLHAETMTLEDALNIAFSQSPTIKQVEFSLSASEHNLKANQASLKSQFSLTLTPYRYSRQLSLNEYNSQYYTSEYTQSGAELSIVQPIKWTDGTFSVSNSFYWDESFSETNRTFFDGMGGFYDSVVSITNSQYNNSLMIRYNQPLFTYNRTMMMQKQLKLELENAQINYALNKLQIENNVTQYFLSLYHDDKAVEIAKEDYANSQESYEIIQRKVEAGISAKEELYQAELSMASSRASLEDSQLQYANALDNFRIYIGLPLDKEINVDADVRKLFVKVELDKAIEHGIQHRMELRQREIFIQNAMDALIQTAANNEFEASVDLSYGLTSNNEKFENTFEKPNKNQSISVILNVPLFDWGKKKHQIASSQANVERQRLNAEEERKDIILQIRRAYRSLQNQETQVEIAEANVRNARLTYELNLERYKNGDLSSKDMSFYQTQLSSKQLGEVQALINYQVKLLDLKIQTLFDFENNCSVLNINKEI